MRLQPAQGASLPLREPAAGDPQVAVLVLATALDYNLYQSETRREDIASVDGLLALFRQAIAALDPSVIEQEERRVPPAP